MLPHDSAIPLLGLYPKRTENLCPSKLLYTNVLPALFIKTKNGKQPKCPSADEQINKMWYIHTMEYYSTTKKIEQSTHTCISKDKPWKHAEMKEAYHQKLHTVWFPLYEMPEQTNPWKKKVDQYFPGAGGKRNGE